jgi:hypothetical protein
MRDVILSEAGVPLFLLLIMSYENKKVSGSTFEKWKTFYLMEKN